MNKVEKKYVCRECWKDLFFNLSKLDVSFERILQLIDEFNGVVGCRRCYEVSK